MNWTFITTASRVVIGCIFIVASIHKIIYPDDFSVAVFRYQLLPSEAINLMALFLPWIELFCGLAVIFVRKFRDAAALLILTMLVGFTVGMIINIFRGVNIACGCFTADPGAETLGWQNVFRNTALIFLTVVVLVQTLRPTPPYVPFSKDAV